MKIKEFSKVELEAMSYEDIAFMILKENGKKMKIITIFENICKLLGLDQKEFEDKIADFFSLLSTDKRFVMLENGYWDLKDNHKTKKIILEEDEDDLLPEELEDEDVEIEEGTDFFDEADETDDEEDEDLQGLSILSDEDSDELM